MKLLPAADLDRLLVELEVDIVTLSECVVSPQRALAFPKMAISAIHYNLSGTGQLLVGNLSPIDLTPHTLVIIPAMMSCQSSSRLARASPTRSPAAAMPLPIHSARARKRS